MFPLTWLLGGFFNRIEFPNVCLLTIKIKIKISIISLEFNPLVELEVITRKTFPSDASNVIVRCKATAPIVDSHMYNAILLNPSVISFFFHENRLPVSNCQPSSKHKEKMCELVIPNLDQEHTGKYYCMARNAIRCTTMAVNIPSKLCKRNCKIPTKKIKV